MLTRKQILKNMKKRAVDTTKPIAKSVTLEHESAVNRNWNTTARLGATLMNAMQKSVGSILLSITSSTLKNQWQRPIAAAPENLLRVVLTQRKSVKL